MPVTWRIADVVVLESDAGATFEEWAAAFDAALADPAYTLGMGVVHDARRIESVLTMAEAGKRIAFVRTRMGLRGAFRYGVLVPATAEAQYEMTVTGEDLADFAGAIFRGFRGDLAEAIAWAASGRVDPHADPEPGPR